VGSYGSSRAALMGWVGRPHADSLHVV